MAVPVALLLAGCGSTQSSLAPKSHQSRDIASLFGWMMGASWIGLGVVVALLLVAWGRRKRRGVPGDDSGSKPGERAGWFVVVGAGIVVPIVLVTVFFVISDIFVIRTTQAPAATATRRTVLVIGHQWWWEIRYPGTGAITANELHIPLRTPVRVEVQTADVIHSFWVPELNRKIDAIPGRTTVVELYADALGRYRGQCAEFCGLQHAHMALEVIAQPRAGFRAWLARQALPAHRPSTDAALAGERYFLTGSCQSCHAIRGTSADGDVGPDLTHIGGRRTIAALTIPNRPSYLAHWIANAQEVKPGNQMPNLAVTGADLRDLVVYLDGLR